MPDVKISGLPAGTVTGTSTVPAVTSSVTHRTTVQDSTAAGLAAYSINIGTSSIGLGIAVGAGQRMRIAGAMSAAPGSQSVPVLCDGTYAADVTSAARAFAAYPSTAASGTAYTLNQMVGFYAANGAKGTNCTINTNYGFLADAGLVQGNLNYGFFGNLPANNLANWNFYAGGTAPSYFNGNVRIGTLAQGLSGLSVFDVVGRSCLTGSGAGEAFALALKHSTAGVSCYLGANATGDFLVSNGGGTAMLTVSQAAGNAVTLAGNSLRISTASTPTSATAGNAGEIRWDTGFLYVCTATGAAGAATWKKVALTAV